MATIEKTDPLASINSILDLISGSSKTQTNSGSTSTTQSNLTPDQVTQQIQAILGSTSGLASVSQGQKQAGVYDSTTNQLLTNDLLARITAETTAKAAGSTTVTSPSTTKITTPSALSRLTTGDALTSIGLAGGTSLAKQGLKKVGFDTDDIMGSIGNIFTPAATSAVAGIGGGLTSSLVTPSAWAASPIGAGALGGDVAGALAGGVGELGGATAGTSSLGLGSGLETTGEIANSVAGSGIGSGFANFGLDAATDSGIAALGASGLADSIAGLGVGDAFIGAAGLTAGAAEAGTAVAASAGIGEVLTAIGAATSFVCMELSRQGLVSDRMVLVSREHAMAGGIHPLVKQGYHIIGIPLALKMRTSPRLSRVIATLMVARSEQLEYDLGNKNHRNYLGLLTRVVGEGLCAGVAVLANVFNLKPRYDLWVKTYPETAKYYGGAGHGN